MDILDLLRKPESKTLEFKRDLSSPEGVLRTIVAFANSAGGIVLIGVEDGDRSVRGVKDPLDIEERLASLITDNIVPLLIPNIEVISWRKTHIVGVEIFPAQGPYYLKSKGHEKGVYVRVGSTNRQADRLLIEELKRGAMHVSFDEQPVLKTNSEAIDFRAASELFKPVKRLTQSDLQTLKLIIRYQNRLTPTNGGMLLFGKERQNFFPDAWIQCGRFNGIDRETINDSEEFHDYPAIAVEKAMEFVQKHSMHGLKLSGNVKNQEKWSMPLAAVREAVMNAVVHADYSQQGMPIRISIFDDRMEIDNPGILPVGLTIDDILKGVSKIRNRVFARVFKELRLIEQWGSGIQRILAECRNVGLPVPQFEEIATHFRVTIYLTPVRPLRLNIIDNQLCEAIRKNDGMSTKSLAEVVGLSTRAVRTRLNSLVARGVLVAIGTSPLDPRRLYQLKSMM